MIHEFDPAPALRGVVERAVDFHERSVPRRRLGTAAVIRSPVRDGAEVTRELTDQEYGSRDFGVRDLEGNHWSFGTYEPT